MKNENSQRRNKSHDAARTRLELTQTWIFIQMFCFLKAKVDQSKNTNAVVNIAQVPPGRMPPPNRHHHYQHSKILVWSLIYSTPMPSWTRCVICTAKVHSVRHPTSLLNRVFNSTTLRIFSSEIFISSIYFEITIAFFCANPFTRFTCKVSIVKMAFSFFNEKSGKKQGWKKKPLPNPLLLA